MDSKPRLPLNILSLFSTDIEVKADIITNFETLRNRLDFLYHPSLTHLRILTGNVLAD
jgi:hypothetical protein